VIDGLTADVPRHASRLAYDIDQIAAEGENCCRPTGQKRFAAQTARRTPSTIVFLVRQGQIPKHHQGLGMIVAKPGISVITPNPKTSGGRTLELSGGMGPTR